jgi:hypothetical protein
MSKMEPGTIIGYRKDGRPIFLQAGGSEPTPTNSPVTINVPPPAPPTDQYFTAAQLEAARQQEKDKLYPRLTAAEELAKSMKTEIDALKAKEDQRQAELDKQKADADAAAKAAAKAAAEDKMTAAQLIAAREKDLLDRQAMFEQTMLLKQAELEKEQKFLALRDLISRRVNEETAQDNIAPEFLDYITGNTEAEVEASITKAKEKTASIAAARAGLTPRLPGVSPTGFGPTGPLDQFTGQTQELTPEQINAMSMEEYKAYRTARGIDKAGKGQGMFG